MQDFRRSYFSKEEYSFRFGIFRENLKEIEELNSNPNDEATYSISEFADWTKEEFEKLLGAKNMIAQPESERRYTEFDTSDLKDDDSFDWSTTGKVQTVKNQGSCGSCWAFGANAALESAYAIAYGQLYDLSEQELVDCTRNYGNYGCGGGWHYNSYRYIEDKSGIA